MHQQMFYLNSTSKANSTCIFSLSKVAWSFTSMMSPTANPTWWMEIKILLENCLVRLHTGYFVAIYFLHERT